MTSSSLSVSSTVGFARSDVKGLLPCADDMSEPAHANLAFEVHCHVRLIDWCFSCEIIDDGFKMTHGSKLYDSLPLSITSNGRHTCCLISDREALANELQMLRPEERSVLQGKKRDALIIRQEHAALCGKWAEDRRQNRWRERNQLRDLRYDAIVEKLTELGWGEEIDWLPNRRTVRIHKLINFEDHPLVKQPKLLSGRNWQNIQDQMVEFLGQMREFRLQREKTRAWDSPRRYACCC
ncbi:hypothetical protein DFH29DRAFT_912036 [Suillus ampliporus]|nr:hypothetical protein DFH29DRAFT_912036 [Suillus ampliporus]